MREIKFRGRTPKGEWFYGDLQQWSNGDVYIGIQNETWTDDGFPHTDDYLSITKVNENTIGQFTGQKDKNGREIYEGDILEYTNPITDVNFVKGYVVYDDNLGAFQFKNKKNQQYYMNPCNGNQENMTIISNIYDNPELLKEE
jgi:uncharacterized phage protein (TIGR01671 family)